MNKVQLLKRIENLERSKLYDSLEEALENAHLLSGTEEDFQRLLGQALDEQNSFKAY